MIFKMPSVSVILFLFSFVNTGLLQGIGSGSNGNLRLCVVEGRGSYKRAPKFCPTLDQEASGVECVIGTDRLDCLRRISKGTVDFGVFSPEDLVAAQWASIDVLVTNEIRHRDRPFERNVVAIINRRILPEGSSSLLAILKNTTLCHPGVGADDIRPLSDTLSGYLESLVLERSCEPGVSHTENRVKALAGYFNKACKAGPWVADKQIDVELKQKYPSLCAACAYPSNCATTDKYWGDSGALTCLGEGAGDVTWAEYDDVTAYFELNKPNATVPEHFVFLCRDGSVLPLDQEPCVWLHRPWNVIVAKRKAAAAVSALAQSLTSPSVTVDKHWRGALASLLEITALKDPLSPPPPPNDYLAKAKGFREAYSQSGCDPPRHINLCTTSLLEKNKCEWLSEAGAVYGIAPPLQCVLRASTEECIEAVKSGDSDVAVAGSDWLVRGKRDYSVAPVLHELTPILEKTNTIVAYVRKDAQITKMADLRGKRAAFPRFDGMSWHAVKNSIEQREKLSCKEFVTNYFKEICAPGGEGKVESDIVKNCYEEGEDEAFKALLEGNADVAFVSMTTFNKFKVQINPNGYNVQDVVPLCPAEMKSYCFISWSSVGHIFASTNVTDVRRQEIINVFGKLDTMFGKHPPFHTPMFSMYGPFNHQPDVLFHNNTRFLTQDYTFDTHPYDRIPLNFEKAISKQNNFECSFGGRTTPSLLLSVVALVAVIFSF